jgi:hypothetical protein
MPQENCPDFVRDGHRGIVSIPEENTSRPSKITVRNLQPSSSRCVYQVTVVVLPTDRTTPAVGYVIVGTKTSLTLRALGKASVAEAAARTVKTAVNLISKKYV